MTLCHFRFRLNDGFGAGFRLNAFGVSAPFLLFLLLAVSRPETVSLHFLRLNGGFGASFLLNAFGFAAPSPSLSLYVSLLLARSLPETVSLDSTMWNKTCSVDAASFLTDELARVCLHCCGENQRYKNKIQQPTDSTTCNKSCCFDAASLLTNESARGICLHC
jgi:hypothetical protein